MGFKVSVGIIFLSTLIAADFAVSEVNVPSDIVYKSAIQSTEEVYSTLSAITEPAKTCPESPQSTNQPQFLPEYYLGLPVHKIRSGMAEVKCSDLFSETPPAFFPKPKTGWWPFCSYAYLFTVASPDLALKSFIVDRDELSSEVDKMIEFHDECTEQKKDVAKRTSGSKIISQNKDHPFMDNESRKRYFAHAKYLRSLVTDSCCGSKDTACKNLMELVDFDLCTNSNENCVPGRAKYVGALFRSDVKSPGLDMGKVYLSPFLDSQNQPLENDATIFHELGHACAVAHIQLQLINSSEEAVKYQNEEDGEANGSNCRLSKYTKKLFADIFSATGASQETIACFQQSARNAPKPLFGTVRGKCEKYCPREFIWEGFAEWMSIAAIPEEKLVPFSLPYECWGARDSKHPAGVEFIKCALKTPAVAEKVKRQFHCKQ
jgi:hypothetical protein